MSQVTGNVVADLSKEFPDLPSHYIASALAILCGAIVLFIGAIRLGWIVDMIPLVALSAFMTGSAINILVGQVPTMMGIKFPKPWTTRDSTYRVIINTLKYLPTTKLDAAMGLTALVMLYAIRSACSFAAKKYPGRQKLIFFVSTMRTVFVILLYTMISWLVNMHRRSDPAFKILGSVPRGEFRLQPPCAGSGNVTDGQIIQVSRTPRFPGWTRSSPVASCHTSRPRASCSSSSTLPSPNPSAA